MTTNLQRGPDLPPEAWEVRVRVRMLRGVQWKQAHGPARSFAFGEVVEIPAALARTYVRSGEAEWLRGPAEVKPDAMVGLETR
jgi:hypothetical protein